MGRANWFHLTCAGLILLGGICCGPSGRVLNEKELNEAAEIAGMLLSSDDAGERWNGLCLARAVLGIEYIH